MYYFTVGKETRIERQTHQKASSSPFHHCKVVNKGGRRHFIQRNGTRLPHFKGYNHGHCFRRTYPNISSSRNSIQGCSKSAIEFSQHQMDGITNVADHLIKELDSIKNMFEQKLIFKSDITGSLANDIDEVCVLHH